MFAADGEAVRERASLALGLTATEGKEGAQLAAPADAPFYELKGAVEAVLGLFDLPAPEWSAAGVPAAMEAGRAASVSVGEVRLGAVGQLAAGEAARRKLRQAVWVAEVDLSALLVRPLRRAVAREISRFQAVERDFSFVMPDAVSWGQVEAAVRALGVAELGELRPAELWRDAKKYPGVYSLLVRTVFQSRSATLTEEELTRWSAGVIGAVQGLGGTLRS